jgi:hypothetical protein
MARRSQGNIMSASSHRIARWLPRPGGFGNVRHRRDRKWPRGRAGTTASINQNHCSVPAGFSRTSSVSSAPVVATVARAAHVGSDQRPPSRNRFAPLYRPEILRLTLFRHPPYIRPRPDARSANWRAAMSGGRVYLEASGWRSSSVGQSGGIIIRVSGVQIPPPLPKN